MAQALTTIQELRQRHQHIRLTDQGKIFNTEHHEHLGAGQPARDC